MCLWRLICPVGGKSCALHYNVYLKSVKLDVNIFVKSVSRVFGSVLVCFRGRLLFLNRISVCESFLSPADFLQAAVNHLHFIHNNTNIITSCPVELIYRANSFL